MPIESNHIGNKIRHIRQLLGIKQATLAKRLGIKQQSVSKMEKKKDITEEQLDNVAKVLDVTADFIKKFDEGVVVNNNFLFNDQINNPVKEVIEYFKEELLKEFNEKEELKEEIESLKAELEALKNGSFEKDDNVKNIGRKAK